MRSPKASLHRGEFKALINDRFLRFHWGQSAEDAVALRLLRNKRDGFYVDVGAHHPRHLSNTYVLHRFFGWRGINIDADADAIAEFRKQRPGDVSVCALVGATGEAREFTKFASANARNTGDSIRAGRLAAQFGVDSVTEMVPQPLGELLAEHVVPGQLIDYLNVDIEGMDLQALQTNDWTRFRPTLISVEDFAVRRGKDSGIARFFKTLGYLRVSHCYDTSFYLPALRIRGTKAGV